MSGAKHGRIVDVACGGHHAVAVSATGRAYTWGRNNHGQLGGGCYDPMATHGPWNVHMPDSMAAGLVTHIACGKNHSVAVKGGVVYTWGCNDGGQTGQPRQTPTSERARFVESATCRSVSER